MHRNVVFYKTSTGRSPIEEFLDGLQDREARKVANVLRLVARVNLVPPQYLRKLLGTDDLWEIRIQRAGNSYRLLGFYDTMGRLVLTTGFQKKQQKTPIQEIDLAHRRRAEYLQRSATHE